MSEPQIVFVPGAWSGPESYKTLSEILEHYGYGVHHQQLPSVGNSNPPKDLSEDIQAVKSLIEAAIGGGNEVIVVGHSWGGIVVGSAATGYDKRTREAKGEKGGVVMLAYIAAFLLPEGVSMMNACGDHAPAFVNLKGPHAVVTDSTALFGDLSQEQRDFWTSRLQSHAFATMQAKSTGAAWREIRTSYLLCEEDQAIPAFAQQQMISSANEAGANIYLEKVKAGHFPFLTQPDAVANFIRRAIGEDV